MDDIKGTDITLKQTNIFKPNFLLILVFFFQLINYEFLFHKKPSVLNFLVSEKLNLFLKQNIFPLESLVNSVNLDYFPLVNLCRKTLLFFSCIIVCFFLILPINRSLCARNKISNSCLIMDVKTTFKVILSAILKLILGKMPLSKIGPNPKTNPKPNPNPNREAVFLECNCLVAPNSKTDPDLDPIPNPNRDVVFLGEQLSGYHKRFYLRNQIRNFQH